MKKMNLNQMNLNLICGYCEYHQVKRITLSVPLPYELSEDTHLY